MSPHPIECGLYGGCDSWTTREIEAKNIDYQTRDNLQLTPLLLCDITVSSEAKTGPATEIIWGKDADRDQKTMKAFVFIFPAIT